MINILSVNGQRVKTLNALDLENFKTIAAGYGFSLDLNKSLLKIPARGRGSKALYITLDLSGVRDISEQLFDYWCYLDDDDPRGLLLIDLASEYKDYIEYNDIYFLEY